MKADMDTRFSNKYEARSYWEARISKVNKMLRVLPFDDTITEEVKEMFKRDLLRDRELAQRNFDETWK